MKSTENNEINEELEETSRTLKINEENDMSTEVKDVQIEDDHIEILNITDHSFDVEDYNQANIDESIEEEREQLEEETAKQGSSKHMKAGFWYTVTSVMTRALGIITTPIYTRLLTTSEYGIAATFTSLYLLLSMFTSLNLVFSVGRAKLDFPDDFENFNGSIQMLSAVWTLFVAIIVMIFLDPISRFLDLEPFVVMLLLVYLFFAPAVVFYQSKLRYTYNYHRNITLGMLMFFGNIIVSLTFIFLLPGQRHIGKIIGNVLPITAISLIVWFTAFKNKTLKINFKYWKYALALSLPLIVNSLSLNILAQSDRLMINKFLGSDEAGIYILAYQYAILIDIVFNSVNQAWLPFFHDHFDQVEVLRKNTRKLIQLGCYVGIGCIALAPEALSILGPSNYSSGVWVVAPVTLGIVCKFIFQQYEHVQLHIKKTYYITIGTSIAAVTNIGLNFLLLEKYGFVAAGYTTLISYMVLMFAHYIVVNKYLKIKLIEQTYVNFAIVVTALAAVGFVLIYDYLLIRLVILVVISLYMGYKFKDEIKLFIMPKLHHA